jgi:hypothetical protein
MGTFSIKSKRAVEARQMVGQTKINFDSIFTVEIDDREFRFCLHKEPLFSFKWQSKQMRRVGQKRVYDCITNYFPARNTMHTPNVYGSGQLYECACTDWYSFQKVCPQI